MLTSLELERLGGALAGKKVLSVYLDGRITDPALRHTGRPALNSALRAARAGVGLECERVAFDRAAALLKTPFPESAGMWSAPGWVAFATEDRIEYVGDLPHRPRNVATWRDGPVVSPYLLALEEQRPVIIALMESRSARLFRFQDGDLEPLGDLSVDVLETPAPGRGAEITGRDVTRPTARGPLTPDDVRHRRLVVFDRLTARLVARLEDLVIDGGWILIGGTPEWARLAASAMPRGLVGRTLLSDAIDRDTAPNTMMRVAKRAAKTLRSRRGLLLLQHIGTGAGPGGRGALGIPAVQRALQSGAVNLLLIAPEFLDTPSLDAEGMVRSAFRQGARVEILPWAVAAHLNQSADGIAARLRFALDQPTSAEHERTTGRRRDDRRLATTDAVL